MGGDPVVARRFVMRRCLGKGGFGEVYEASMITGSGPARRVAIKLLHESLGDNDQAVRRMKEEGRLLRRLSHPNVLALVDLTRLDERVALVTEYIEGADLSTCIRDGDLRPRVVVEVVAAIARALHAAYHDAPDGRGPLRLVHRDVKPSNIRLGREGRVVLLDFGIARSDEITRGIVTASDLMVGSAPYLAPERFRKGPPLLASDVFALGVTAYEALTGRRFVNLGLPVQAAHSLDPDLWGTFVARRLAAAGSALEPAALRTWVASLLVHDPEARPDAEICAVRAEALAQTLPGPGLVGWARARHWPVPPPVSGSLTGVTLDEAQLQHRETEARPRQVLPTQSSIPTLPAPEELEPHEPFEPAAPAGWGGWWVAGAGLLGGLALAASVLVVVAAGVWQGRSSGRRLVDAGASLAEVSPDTGDPAPPVRLDPSPPLVSATLGESTASTQAAVRVAPEPVPVSKPAPAAGRSPELVDPARVRLDNDKRSVWLTRTDDDGTRIDLGLEFVEIQPRTYHLWIESDDAGAIRAISGLDLRGGAETTIRCDDRMNTCSPE